MITAWHFVGDTLRDGRAIPPDGEWLAHNGPVVMCESGLHASRDPFDALRFAPGETICMVECEDVVSEDYDKLVCRRRRIVARRDAGAMLRSFARAQALAVAHLWDCPPVVRQYLETGDESLRVSARAAAWAASTAARAASAAWAASDAARAAAWAASDAAWAASAESDALAALAAWAARAASTAWAASAAASAASDAARDAARSDFNRRVEELFA
jgi:hypothetical protein